MGSGREGHRRAGARGPQAGQVEKSQFFVRVESNQPGFQAAGIDGPAPLKDLGKRSPWMNGDIQDAALLLARWSEMMIEAGVGGPVGAERVPGDRVARASEVDAKEG